MSPAWKHRTSIRLDGVERDIEIARLTIGELANVRLMIRALSQQTQRVETMIERSAVDIRQLLEGEKALNLYIGEEIVDAIGKWLRPVAPWVGPDDTLIDSGAAFCAAYGNDEIEAAFMAVYLANMPGVTLRKNSPSPLDSTDGSLASASRPSGDIPATPVDRAGDAEAIAIASVPGQDATINPPGTTAGDSSPRFALSEV